MNQSSPVLNSFANSCSVILMMLFCLVPLLISLSGCSRTALDKSLLTDEPCSAPCWHNLVPGESTEADVRRELEGSPWVKANTLDSTPTIMNEIPVLIIGWEDRGRGLRETLRDAFNSVQVTDGKASLITIYLDYDLSLGEVVAKYGPPEGVYALETRSFGCKAILDYPAKGLTFSSYSPSVDYEDVFPRKGVGVLSEDLKVTSVAYYAPTSLESALRDVFLLYPDRIERMLSDEQPWQGFGEVKLAYYSR